MEHFMVDMAKIFKTKERIEPKNYLKYLLGPGKISFVYDFTIMTKSPDKSKSKSKRRKRDTDASSSGNGSDETLTSQELEHKQRKTKDGGQTEENKKNPRLRETSQKAKLLLKDERMTLPKSTGGRPYKRFPTSPKGNLSVELYEAMAAKKEATKQRAADLKLLREQGKGSYTKRWVDIQPREPSGRRGNSIQNRNQHEQQMTRGLAQSMIDIRGHHATLVKKKEHQSSKNLMTGAACGTEAKKTKPKVMSKVKSFRDINDPVNNHIESQKAKSSKRPTSTVLRKSSMGQNVAKTQSSQRPKSVPKSSEKSHCKNLPPVINLPDLYDRGTGTEQQQDEEEEEEEGESENSNSYHDVKYEYKERGPPKDAIYQRNTSEINLPLFDEEMTHPPHRVVNTGAKNLLKKRDEIIKSMHESLNKKETIQNMPEGWEPPKLTITVKLPESAHNDLQRAINEVDPSEEKQSESDCFNKTVNQENFKALCKGFFEAKRKMLMDVVQEIIEHHDHNNRVIDTEIHNRYVERETPKPINLTELITEGIENMRRILNEDSVMPKIPGGLNNDDIEGPPNSFLPSTYSQAKLPERHVKSGLKKEVFGKVGDVELYNEELLNIANEGWYDDSTIDALIHDMMEVVRQRSRIAISTTRARSLMEEQFEPNERTLDAFRNYVESTGPSTVGLLIPMMHDGHWRLLQVNILTGGLHIFDPFRNERDIPQAAINDIERLLRALARVYPNVPGFQMPRNQWVAMLRDNFMTLPDIDGQDDTNNCGPILVEAIRMLMGDRELERTGWTRLPERIRDATVNGQWNNIRGMHIRMLEQYAPRSWNLLENQQIQALKKNKKFQEDPEKIKIPDNPRDSGEISTEISSEEDDEIAIVKVVKGRKKKKQQKLRPPTKKIAANNLDELKHKYGAVIEPSDTIISETKAQEKWEAAKIKRMAYEEALLKGKDATKDPKRDDQMLATIDEAGSESHQDEEGDEGQEKSKPTKESQNLKKKYEFDK